MDLLGFSQLLLFQIAYRLCCQSHFTTKVQIQKNGHHELNRDAHLFYPYKEMIT